MNSDDFEKRLQRQPLRQLPTEWRREILNTAETAAASSSPLKTQNSGLKTFLYQLLWPCPQAWAGLAAVWIAIAAVNFMSGESTQRTSTQTMASSSERRMALRQQRDLLAELMTPSPDVAEPPKTFVPRPRSECRYGIMTA